MATDWDRRLQNLLTFDNLEKPVREHLKHVYSCLSIAMLLAAAGSYVHINTQIMQAGLLSVFASLGLLLMLGITQHSRENVGKRLAYLMGFSFFSGVGIGPLIEHVIDIDPSILPTAFFGTAIIFISFSLSSLLSSDRKWLYLGGFLFSGLSWLMMISLLNIFVGSVFLADASLYLGLLLMCGFVLYDTQLIVERVRCGDNDYIWHSVNLFTDFIAIFRRLMIILANKDRKKRRD